MKGMTFDVATAAVLGPTMVALPHAPGSAAKLCQLSRLTPWHAPSLDSSEGDEDLCKVSSSSNASATQESLLEWAEEVLVTCDDLVISSGMGPRGPPSLLRRSMSSPVLGRRPSPLVSPATRQRRPRESAMWRGPRPIAEAVQWVDVECERNLHSVRLFDLIPEEVELRTPHRQGCCVVM